MNRFEEFIALLRSRGLDPGPDRVADAVVALALLPEQPRRVLRTTLCGSKRDLDIFDEVWQPAGEAEAVFSPSGPEPASAGSVDRQDDDEEAAEGAGSQTGLAERDVRNLTEAERAEIARLVAELAPAARSRPSARRTPAGRGRIDARRTARLMFRSGGEPYRIVHTRRARKPRRLLLLVDVSGSMKPYTDVMLRFGHAAVTAGPGLTEVFALGTKWTRLTGPLLERDADAAMAAVAALPSDWDRGTKLGPALQDFLRRWAGRVAVRSAVIVVISDGQESGDKSVLPNQVARLSRLGSVLIWVNPAHGRPRYVPVNPGLTRSLPYAAEHLPGHTIDALRRLTEVISR
jgi:uncharacterized protein with von Willebrand factor type A (vWA) domain